MKILLFYIGAKNTTFHSSRAYNFQLSNDAKKLIKNG